LWRVFQDRVSWTICLGWLHSTILPFFASWVARILTGMSHRHPALYKHLLRSFFFFFFWQG
jgi:hypothetical protein